MEGLDMTKAGLKGSVVMLLAIVGAPLGGWLADVWYRKRKDARLLFPALSSLVTGILLFIAFALLRGTPQFLMLLLCGVTAVGFVSAAVAVTQDVVHPGLRAISLSLNVIIQHILGSSIGPPLIGALSDRLGLETAMLFIPAFNLVAFMLFFIGSRFYEADLAKVVKIDIKMG
jgi:MFS family permease